MKNILRTTALFAVLATGLSACGNDDSSVPTPPPPTNPPAAPQAFVERFGVTFASTIRADPNSDPRDPAPGDVPPLTLTADATTD